MGKKGVIWTIITLVLLGAGITIFLMNNKKETEYAVTFDSNGGSIVDTIYVKKGEQVSRPSSPTRSGYIFRNWYLDDEVFDFNSEITKDITLVAKWDADNSTDKVYYTVKFDNIYKNVIPDQRVESGKKATKPTTNPTNTGMTFDGWYLDDKAYDFTDPVTKDITLTAKWKVNQTNNNNNNTNTTVNATGVTLNTSSITLNIGQTSTLTATVNPTNTTNKNVTWSSSNTSVATVNNGVVTAVSAGTATITVTTSNGKTATATITVNPNPDVYTFSVSIIENVNDQDRAVRIYKNGTEITADVTLLKTADNRTAANKLFKDGYFKVNINYLNIAKITYNGTEYTVTQQ